jgi:hypothetical protein
MIKTLEKSIRSWVIEISINKDRLITGVIKKRSRFSGSVNYFFYFLGDEKNLTLRFDPVFVKNEVPKTIQQEVKRLAKKLIKQQKEEMQNENH